MIPGLHRDGRARANILVGSPCQMNPGRETAGEKSGFQKIQRQVGQALRRSTAEAGLVSQRL